MKKPFIVKTNNREIYMKLPTLNHANEVIFSCNVSDRALKKIMGSFEKNGISIEHIRLGDKNVLIKKGSGSFNTYFINSL